MRSAREDTIRGAIDKIAGRVPEAFGRLTRNRNAVATGKATRIRGAGRSAKAASSRAGDSAMGLLRGLGAVVGGLLAAVGGLLATGYGLLKGLIIGVGTLLRRLL